MSNPETLATLGASVSRMIGGEMSGFDLGLNLRAWAAGQTDGRAAHRAEVNLSYVGCLLVQGYGGRGRLWIALHVDRYAVAAAEAVTEDEMRALSYQIGADMGAADTAGRRALLGGAL